MKLPFFKRARSGAPRTTSAAVPAVQAGPDPEARAKRIGDLVRSGDPDFMLKLFGADLDAPAPVVTLQSAMSIPAMWAAVNFLARTLASLPIKAFEKTAEGRVALEDGITALLNEAPNDESTAFAAKQAFWVDVFTAGRGIAFIERNGAGAVINIWPLEMSRVMVERKAGRLRYVLREAGGREVAYAASEVLDICFTARAGKLTAPSPVFTHARTVGLALAIRDYGAKFFRNGGIPPFMISGPFKTPGGVARASSELTDAVTRASSEGRNALAVPDGHTLTPLGVDPEKMQMVQSQRFIIEDVARIYGLPPVFLQDLTNGTFSNTEQQDLQFVKHCLVHWTVAYQQECRLKLYGRGGNKYVEIPLAGITRGDFKSRAEALGQQINTGQLTPNEARELENRANLPGGDGLLVQGAMVRAETLNTEGQSNAE